MGCVILTFFFVIWLKIWEKWQCKNKVWVNLVGKNELCSQILGNFVEIGNYFEFGKHLICPKVLD